MNQPKAPYADWASWDQFFTNLNSATAEFSQGFANDDIRQLESALESLDRSRDAVRRRIDRKLREAIAE